VILTDGRGGGKSSELDTCTHTLPSESTLVCGCPPPLAALLLVPVPVAAPLSYPAPPPPPAAVTLLLLPGPGPGPGCPDPLKPVVALLIAAAECGLGSSS
jgi:hypothetical protein